MTNIGSKTMLMSSEAPPIDYDRAPSYERMIREMDVYVPMRDGVKICVDVYRPDTNEKLPALLAFAIYNKDFQGPDVPESFRRSRHGLRCGPGRLKPATRTSSCRADTSTSSDRRAASENRRAAVRGNGTATI